MIKKLKEDEKGVKIVFASSEKFFEDRAREFFEKFVVSADVTRVSSVKLEPSQLESLFETRGLFSDISLIHLQNCEKLKKESSRKLLDLLKKKPDKTHIFIEYVGDLSPRNKNLDDVWKEIIKLFPIENCNPSSGRSYILKRAEKEGITVDESAVLALSTWASKDLFLLPSAMDLLILSSIETKIIEEKDVVELLGTGGSGSVFELVDKFLLKDTSGVVEAIKKIENDPDASPIAFVSILNKQFQYLGKIRCFLSKGMNFGEITPQMVDKRLYFFQFEKIKNLYHKWSEEEIFKVISSLATLDKTLKGDPIEAWLGVEKYLLYQIERVKIEKFWLKEIMT